MATIASRLWLRDFWLHIAAVVGFVLLLSSTAGPFRSVSGAGVSSTEANRRLWNCHVPQPATDVWFSSGYRGTLVECSLPRAPFQDWCRSNGWQVEPIAPDVPAYVHSERDGALTVRHGLRFSKMNKDVGFRGIYDEERGRAFAMYSGG